MTRFSHVALTVFGFAGVVASFIHGARDEFLTGAILLIISGAAITFAGSRLIDGARK